MVSSGQPPGAQLKLRVSAGEMKISGVTERKPSAKISEELESFLKLFETHLIILIYNLHF